MYLPEIELHQATTLEQATGLMTRLAPDARLLAGGTDLLVDLKTGRFNVGHLISINGISELCGVRLSEDGLRIGALTTITQLGTSPLLGDRFAPILDATREMAAVQIRNVATVGGNIASAVPCADLPPVLMVLSASVTLWSPNGQRTVPLESFFVGPRQTIMGPDEILSAIEVPNPQPGFGGAYARLALRGGNGIAVAGVAAGLVLDESDVISDARLAIGAVAPIPKLVPQAATSLIGKPADEGAFEQAAIVATEAAEPISDIRGSAEYRREMVGVLTHRALAAATERAREAAG